MAAFELLLTFPAGVMVSGYSSVADGLHGESAQDGAGNPVVPSTAIRGALREGLEAVLRGAGHAACAGGDGVDPAQPREPGAAVDADERPCKLGDGGERCITCRIFGSRRLRLESAERAFSALFLENARLQGESPGWVHRPGVAIQRRLRSAANDLLFLQRTAGGGRVFRARGRLIDDSLLGYLEAAARATTHIGAGKSRGLARVEIEVRPMAPEAQEPAVRLPPGDEMRLRVTLESPASFGEAVNDENAYDTRRYVPGSALRGAVGFTLAEALPDPNNDGPFQNLVAEEGAIFGFLYPVDDASDTPAAPLPITAVWCKRHGRDHGIVDALLDRIVARNAGTAQQAMAVEATSIDRCTKCQNKLRGAKGGRRLTSDIGVRAVTRAATDRSLRSAKDEALFTQVLIETGARFEGKIRRIPRGEEERGRLVQALSGPLSMGRGRSAGWGRVRIEILAPSTLGPLRERKRDFESALSTRFTQVEATLGMAPGADLAGRLVPVTLLSPLLATKPGSDGADDLVEATGASSCYLSARRFTREGGWDQRLGKMEAVLATATGGVFVLEFATAADADRALQSLEELERAGVGQRRHQGYGEVICFDPFILQRRFFR